MTRQTGTKRVEAVAGIGAMIRKQREALKMTGNQLADAVGVSRNTIVNYEAGKTEPTSSDLVRLADALGSRIEDLLGIGPVESPPKFAFRAHAALRKDASVIVFARKFLRAYSEIEELTEAVLCDRLKPFVCAKS